MSQIKIKFNILTNFKIFISSHVFKFKQIYSIILLTIKMKSIKNDEISKKFISDDKFLKNNQFTDSLDTENIIKLLKEKPYLLNQPQEKFGFTILYKAVVNKNYNLCEFLIENNADPNLKNIYGETPLHQAIEVENNKIINLLLENGADPNSKTNVCLL